MKQIINYLDNMFATLPKTKQMKDLKEDLLSNMEDKYNELKRSGKSENEAVGIVISEFGNIDEIIKEFDIGFEYEKEDIPILDEEEVNDYLSAYKKKSMFIGIGVFLCLLATALLISIPQLIEDGFITDLSLGNGHMFSMIPFLSFIAIAVGMFIYAGIVIDKYEYIEDSFLLPSHVRISIEHKKDSFKTTYIISLITGVMLCVLSPIALFVTSVMYANALIYGVAGLLLIVAAAVYILIYFGGINSSYNELLKVEEYSENNKVISAVEAIVWPLAVVIFLISGLVYHKWYINWIIFPIVGILFEMFSRAYTILKKN